MPACLSKSPTKQVFKARVISLLYDTMCQWLLASLPSEDVQACARRNVWNDDGASCFACPLRSAVIVFSYWGQQYGSDARLGLCPSLHDSRSPWPYGQRRQQYDSCQYRLLGIRCRAVNASVHMHIHSLYIAINLGASCQLLGQVCPSCRLRAPIIILPCRLLMNILNMPSLQACALPEPIYP